MTKRSSFSAVVYLALVFLSGALVGAFGYRLYMVNTVSSNTRSPEEYRKHYVEEMTGRLHLSADQISNLQRIMDETRQRYHDLHDRQKPEIKGIEAQQYQNILAILSDPQRAEYEKMRAEREQRRKQEKQQDANRK